jgi:hypothetical protein
MTKALVANMARHHPLVMTVTITTVIITTIMTVMTGTITTVIIKTGTGGTRAINALFVTTHTIFMRSVSRADKWTNI